MCLTVERDDKISDEAMGTVMYKLPSGILCSLDKKSLKKAKG